jgi:hypothetical protein
MNLEEGQRDCKGVRGLEKRGRATTNKNERNEKLTRKARKNGAKTR